ncbi:14138_t:CDS:1, partial [Funneliformis geosporum]
TTTISNATISLILPDAKISFAIFSSITTSVEIGLLDILDKQLSHVLHILLEISSDNERCCAINEC